MNPIGFDPFSMTDQELLDKTVEVYKRLAYVGKFSQDGRLIEQIQNMAAACSFAQQERNQIRMFEALNKNRPEEIDISAEKKIIKTNGTNKDHSANKDDRPRVMRTSRPIKE